MRIINPIYDAAFKYLMEDAEIARQLIGKIIGEEIERLVLHPQELTSRSEKYNILIFRLDFKATIRTQSGAYKTVLIELQKAKMYDDLLRFRSYLGESYRKTAALETETGLTEQHTLPIITIYFLGFSLPKIETSILKINREYLDLISGKKLNVQTDFVEKLTHDSYVILIPELPHQERTELEGILKVFSQHYQLDSDWRLLEINEADFGDNELTKNMLARLLKGASNKEVLKKLIIEEEIESTIEHHIRDKEMLREQLNKQIEVKDEALLKQQKLIEELKQQLKNKKE